MSVFCQHKLDDVTCKAPESAPEHHLPGRLEHRPGRPEETFYVFHHYEPTECKHRGKGFNWHEEPQASFKSWLLPTLLAELHQDEKWEKIAAATDKFTNVELTIFVNGIEVDASDFIEGVERNMEHYADHAAKDMVLELTNWDGIEEILSQLRRNLRSDLEKLGVMVHEDEWH